MFAERLIEKISGFHPHRETVLVYINGKAYEVSDVFMHPRHRVLVIGCSGDPIEKNVFEEIDSL